MPPHIFFYGSLDCFYANQYFSNFSYWIPDYFKEVVMAAFGRLLRTFEFSKITHSILPLLCLVSTRIISMKQSLKDKVIQRSCYASKLSKLLF